MDHLIVVDVPDLLCFSHMDRLKMAVLILNLTFRVTVKGGKLEGQKRSGIERAQC